MRSGGNERRALEPENALPPHPPTVPGGPRPSYFSCRHTYEDTLIQEITTRGPNEHSTVSVETSSPFPGLVCVENGLGVLPPDYDPAYALQALPNCVVVNAPSIKALAGAVCKALLGEDETETRETFRKAPRGSLAVHALVPGMFKGQRDPVSKRRAYTVADDVAAQLQKIYPAARKRSVDEDSNSGEETERWVLQLLLLEPEVMAASLVRCTEVGGRPTWPNWFHPAGFAQVDIEGDMPSSAYRKLLEAFHCMRDRPPRYLYDDLTPAVVDLGACPGGWTAALRLMGCSVVAVDRSPLDPTLMFDDKVHFVKGDAFKYEPELTGSMQNAWMVSDVIAYPERVGELLDRWCGGRWAAKMVVTVKFKGEVVAWDELESVMEIAKGHGYTCRAKHFFNNKNEVTLVSPNDLEGIQK